MGTTIKRLVEYFNGPNVAKFSIYLQMGGAYGDDAKDFFDARSALKIDGYVNDFEAEARIMESLGVEKNPRRRS